MSRLQRIGNVLVTGLEVLTLMGVVFGAIEVLLSVLGAL